MTQDVSKREHTSYSQISTYRECPRKWAFRYVYRLERERLAQAMVFGGAIHRTLARIYAKKMLSNQPMTLEEVSDHFVDDWDQAIDDAEIAIDYGLTDRDSLQAKGLGMLAEFAKLPMGLEVVGVEKEFRADLFDPVTGELMDKQLLGYIDALVMVGGDLVVHEHKTGSRKWQQGRIDHDLQASVYQWATNAKRVTFNVLMKTKEPRVDCYQTTRSKEQLDEALLVMVNALKQQQAGFFEARRVGEYGWHCGRCEFAQQCASRGPI